MALEELFDRKFVLAFQYIGTGESIFGGARYTLCNSVSLSGI